MVLAALYFMDMAGMPLRAVQTAGYTGSTRSYRAEITKVQCKKDGTLGLEARITAADGRKVYMKEKVLLRYYDEVEEPWELFHGSIEFLCCLEEPEGRRNPNCFD